MTKYYDDIKIGTELNVKMYDKIKKVKVSNIIIEAYISDYKVVVKYVDELNIQYTDYINSFLDKIVFDDVFDESDMRGKADE